MIALVTGVSSPLANAIHSYFDSSQHQIILKNRHDFCVTNPIIVKDFFDKNEIDLLIYIAAINLDQLIFQTSIANWNHLIKVNLTGAFVSIINWLSEPSDQSKHVILVSSYSGIHPHLGQIAYSTSKAALIGLMQGMIKEQAQLTRNRFNVILPGRFVSNISKLPFNSKGQSSLKHVAQFIDVLHHQMPRTTGQIFNLDNRSI